MNRSTDQTNNQPASKSPISSGLWKMSLLIVGLMIVAGCGNSTQQESSSTSATQSENNIVEPTVTETAPATTEQESSQSTDHAAASTPTDSTDDVSTSAISGKQIWAAAQLGTLPDLPEGLSLGSSRATLFQLQGKPKLGGTEGPMLSYGTLDVAFDHKDTIVELTSSGDAYHHLKMSTVIADLGKPDETNDTSKDVAYTAEATYYLTHQDIPKYFLVFSYHTQTQKIQYVRLYENIQ